MQFQSIFGELFSLFFLLPFDNYLLLTGCMCPLASKRLCLSVYMCVCVCSRFPAFQQDMLVSFLKQLKIVCSHLVAFLFITSSIFSSFFQYFLFSFIPSIIRCSNVVFSFSFEDLQLCDFVFSCFLFLVRWLRILLMTKILK